LILASSISHYKLGQMWMQEEQLQVPLFLQVSESQLFGDVCVCEADEEACSNVIQEVVGIDDDEDDGDPST